MNPLSLSTILISGGLDRTRWFKKQRIARYLAKYFTIMPFRAIIQTIITDRTGFLLP